MRSACRGVARNAPAPNRSRSKRLAPTAIISIAQHASPNVIGQSEFFRPQLMKKSRLVTIRPSSKRFSIQDMKGLLQVRHRFSSDEVFPIGLSYAFEVCQCLIWIANDATSIRPVEA